MTLFVAERKLLYSEKGSEVRFEFVVRVGIPYALKDDTGVPVFCCRIDFDGLDEEGLVIYGMDSLQALNLASDFDRLVWLRNKYDIFWLTGEPYFEN